jgi:hypothetical protein
MLEDELKRRRKKLEAAINEALTDSPRVSEIIQDLREGGYDVFLIIEATVGLSKRKDPENSTRQEVTSTRLHLTSQDEKFLKSLKIKPD